VFRQLVARGYLSVDMARFGALRLEEKCRPLLRGEETIELRRDIKQPKGAKRQTKTPLTEDLDVALWESLRDRRRRFAEDQGVPPYVIFHDSTLQEMCAVMPQSLAEFARLGGVGERKLEKYGQDFLQVINDHLGSVQG
jgi:ATP-dependent DNA helicase RecQ